MIGAAARTPPRRRPRLHPPTVPIFASETWVKRTVPERLDLLFINVAMRLDGHHRGREGPCLPVERITARCPASADPGRGASRRSRAVVDAMSRAARPVGPPFVRRSTSVFAGRLRRPGVLRVSEHRQHGDAGRGNEPSSLRRIGSQVEPSSVRGRYYHACRPNRVLRPQLSWLCPPEPRASAGDASMRRGSRRGPRRLAGGGAVHQPPSAASGTPCMSASRKREHRRSDLDIPGGSDYNSQTYKTARTSVTRSISVSRTVAASTSV